MYLFQPLLGFQSLNFFPASPCEKAFLAASFVAAVSFSHTVYKRNAFYCSLKNTNTPLSSFHLHGVSELAWGILTVIKMRAAGKKISSGLFKHSYSILNFQRTKPCHFNCSLRTGKGRLAKGMCKDKMQETNPWKLCLTAIKAAKGMSWCPSDISMFPPEYFCWRFTQSPANSSNIKEWCTSLIRAQESDNSDKELQTADYRVEFSQGLSLPTWGTAGANLLRNLDKTVGALGAVKGIHANKTLQISREKRAALYPVIFIPSLYQDSGLL